MHRDGGAAETPSGPSDLSDPSDLSAPQTCPLPRPVGRIRRIGPMEFARGVPRQEGGARYNFSGIFGVGLSVVTDSLAALRRLVYEERSVSREELLEALRTDFRDREMLRQAIDGFLNRSPFVPGE